MKLIELIKEFREARKWNNNSEASLVKSIVVESAELLEHFQFQEKEYDKELVCNELADILIYCHALCIKLDVTPEEIVSNKLIDVARRYPVVKD